MSSIYASNLNMILSIKLQLSCFTTYRKIFFELNKIKEKQLEYIDEMSAEELKIAIGKNVKKIQEYFNFIIRVIFQLG